jgi:hypothetical protein
MGQVVVVDGEKGFVLVRSPLAASAVPDGVLVVKAQGTAATTGRLKVSPERSRNQFAADVLEGSPKVGEVVFFETTERVVSTAPPPAEAGVGSLPAGTAGAVAGGAVEGGLPAEVSPGPEPGGGGGRDLPPLGEPSGPREFIPDFPGLEPLPPAGVAPAGGEQGGVEPIDVVEPADPSAPSAP